MTPTTEGTQKRCSRCKTTEGKFVIYNRSGRHIYYHCLDCNTARMRSYRQTEAGKAAVLRASRSYEQRKPHMRKAWRAANYRYKAQPCEICGSTENVDRHHDDPAMTLNIIFLCRPHHKERHRWITEGVPA